MNKIIPSNIVMEKYVKPAMTYYRSLLDKIEPYFFCDSLIKLVGFQQLIVSKTYQIKREDARSKKGIDYVRECVTQIQKPSDLIDLMGAWYAFDLCYTGPSFVNPVLASNIRKKYCLVGEKYFDCHNCTKITCKENLIWNKSSIVLDFDSKSNKLRENYFHISNVLNDLNFDYSIKLSSLGGLHIIIGLPKDRGTTIFDRNVYHYCVLKELKSMGIDIDDNSLDPVPIIRVPYSLHYKRLTPSLPINEERIDDALDILTTIETYPLKERISQSLQISRKWKLDWKVNHSDSEVFNPIISKWEEKARKAIFRVKKIKERNRTNVGMYLRKGNEMTIDDEEKAYKLLLKEGKSEELAKTIIKINKRKQPKKKKVKEQKEEEILLKIQQEIPKKVLDIPPPLIFIIIDNASLSDMQKITGVQPISVKAQSTNTKEGMTLLFKDSKLLKNYPKKWNSSSVYIGGLHSAYNFCSSADIVIAIKEKNVWDRDMMILKELEKIIKIHSKDFITIHLLGLDFCKDHNLNPEGAILIFKNLMKSLISTDYNIVLSSDHSGEEYVPYFEIFNHP